MQKLSSLTNCDIFQEYLTCLNEFRTSLPARLPHIEPVAPQDSAVRNTVQTISTQYRDLLNRANALSERLSGVGGRQREYRDALDKARNWMRDAEPRANKVQGQPKLVLFFLYGQSKYEIFNIKLFSISV